MQSGSPTSPLFNHLKTSVNDMLPITRYNKIHISHILWNPEVHRLVQNSPPLISILSQINPVHTPTNPISLRWFFYIILPSQSGSSKWFLSFQFSAPNLERASLLPHTCHMPHPYNHPKCYHTIKSDEKYNHGAPHFEILPLPCYLVTLRSKYLPRQNHM